MHRNEDGTVEQIELPNMKSTEMGLQIWEYIFVKDCLDNFRRGEGWKALLLCRQ